MRTENLLICIIFEQFLQAGHATAVLVHAHHHGCIVSAVEFSHAQEALQFYFVFEQVLNLFSDSLTSKQFACHLKITNQ